MSQYLENKEDGNYLPTEQEIMEYYELVEDVDIMFNRSKKKYNDNITIEQSFELKKEIISDLKFIKKLKNKNYDNCDIPEQELMKDLELIYDLEFTFDYRKKKEYNDNITTEQSFELKKEIISDLVFIQKLKRDKLLHY